MAEKKKKADATPLAQLANAMGKIPHDDEAEKRWPNLYACLMPVWEGGKCKRQSGRLSVRITGSWFVLTLSCPTEGLQCSISCPSLFSLMDLAETILANGQAQWEPDWESTKKARQVRIDTLKSD